jgi:type IV secretory pathway TrbD component
MAAPIVGENISCSASSNLRIRRAPARRLLLCGAAPFVLLFSGVVSYGVRSLIH